MRTLTIEGDAVRAEVRTQGAMVVAAFRVGDAWVDPYARAPWTPKEALAAGAPPVVAWLRGDFFCLPFGANDDDPDEAHGAPASREWTVDGDDPLALTLADGDRLYRAEFAPAGVRPALRQRVVVSGPPGPVTFGRHATLAFPEPGRLVTSSVGEVRTFPGEFEPTMTLPPGERFEALTDVAGRDLTRFPDAPGTEELVMFTAGGDGPLAWNAVEWPFGTWFEMRDARVLPATVLWRSEGGRPYAPWSGRHRDVMGVESVRSWFHLGLRETLDAPLAGLWGDGGALDVRTVSGMVEGPFDPSAWAAEAEWITG